MFIKTIGVLFLSIMFIACGSDKKDVTKDGKTPSDNYTKTTDTKETSTPASDVLLAKIGNIESVSENNMVPNFSWEGNHSGSFNDYKDDVVFLNFWATWCGPCIKEMPDLSEISNELSNKNFKMIGLNVFHQPGTKDVETFLKELPVSYLIVDGNEEIVNAFSKSTGEEINAVPTSYIVKDGKIVETIIGARSKAQFLEMINKYL